MQRSTIPTLVFGCGITGLGVLRTLGRGDIPSYTICDSPAFLANSRWYRPLPAALAAYPQLQHLAEFLESLPLERAVLLPCTDEWLRAVAGLPVPLTNRFPASIAPPAAIETMLDKWRFAQLLEQERIPHPQTILLQSPEELEARPETAFNHTFLKPRASHQFFQAYGVKACMVKNRTDAIRTLRDVSRDGFSMMLQEYIPGPPCAHYFIDGFIDRNGRVCARFARRRLRMHPTDFGNSTFMISVPLEDVAGAAQTLDRLWAVVPYRGIFSAEFKYDERDGLFKILEVNARPWWYIEFAARSGVDVCRLAYLDALGLPVEPVMHYKSGRRSGFLYHDVAAYKLLRDHGQGSLWSWLHAWIGAEETLLRWNDPGPAAAFFLTHLRSYIWKQVRR